MISAIFATDEHGGLGLNSTMPWPTNSDDLAWFKSKTTGHVVVMGKGTWDSVGMPKPLPNRINVVVTNNKIENNGVIVYAGDVCKLLLKLEETYPDKEIFVIGGADLLKQSKNVIKKIYLSTIPGNYNCTASIDIAEFTQGFSIVETVNTGNVEINTYEATN